MEWSRRQYLALLGTSSLAGCTSENTPQTDQQEDSEMTDRTPRHFNGQDELTSDVNNQTAASNEVYSDKLAGDQRLRATYDANQIRANAGVPNGEPVGVRGGKSAGLADSSVLTDATDISITSESDASSAAASGSGTESDPYIIKDKLLNNANSIGFKWDDSDASYYITLRNCEISTYDTAQIQSKTGTKLTVEDCLLYSNGGIGYGIRNDAGDLDVHTTEFAGFGSQDGIFGAATKSNTVTVRNCAFTNSKNAWGSYKAVEPIGTGTIDLQYCDVTAPSITAAVTIDGYDCELSLKNLLVRNGAKLVQTTFGGSGQLIGDGATIKYCQLEDNQILFAGVGNAAIDIGYSEIINPGSGVRGIYLTDDGNGNLTENARVHHCRFVKSNGTGAGNECCESRAGRHIEFDHCWVDGCTEDAFEHIFAISQTSVHHCVGDNVSGQIVDFYHARSGEDGTEGTGFPISSSVHHIYGDCNKEAVLITDADDVTVGGHIHVDAGGMGVKLEQRDGASGATPANCKVVGPLPLAENSSTIFGTEGTVGSGNWAVWMDGNSVQTYGSPPSTVIR